MKAKVNKMKNFLKSLFASKPQNASLVRTAAGRPINIDLQIAVAGLMIEVAGADHEIDEREVELVCDLLVSAFGVSEDEVDALVERAIKIRKSKQTSDQFIETVKSAYNANQLVRVLSMIWRLVGADSRVTSEEYKLANDLKFRLGLSSEQAAEAQKMAEEAVQ